MTTITSDKVQNPVILIPDTNGLIEPVIIDKKVLMFLTSLLAKTDVEGIAKLFADRLQICARAISMEEYITMLQEELAFHMSVNMIQHYFNGPKIPKSKLIYGTT